MKNTLIRIPIVALLLLTTAFQSLCLAETIRVGATTRDMLTYVPSKLEAKRPLIVSMHGMSQDAAYQKNMAAWETIADTARFAVVFPQGISNSWDISGNTDIEFVLAVIDTMVNRYQCDRNRVYLSGFSMGGMFTYHAMGKIADRIAAFAPISGYPMGGSTFTSSRPVPIIHTHGTDDNVVAYSGVAAVMSGWTARNGCPSTAVVTKPYPTTKSGSIATKYLWGPGLNGVEVVLMELTGKGHWISNDVANGVHTSEEIWKFCRRYALDLRSPQVKLTSPVTGTTCTNFGGTGTVPSLELSATASDPDGTVASVAFYDGSTLLFTDSVAPYAGTWKNIAAGSHTLKAVVTDNEGRTGESTAVLTVKAPTSTVVLSDGFTAAGALPAGWITNDGAALRTGPQSGLSSGCRILGFTGSPRDFDFGMYIRNSTGGAGLGSLTYAAPNSNASLSLAPGIYTLQYTAASWNMASFGDVTSRIEQRANGNILAGRTARTTSNVGNATTNSFSGSSTETLWFQVTDTTDAVVRFCTADYAWSDALLTHISLNRQESNELNRAKCVLAKALFDAGSALVTAADALYAGSDYDALKGLVAQYNSWSSDQTAAYAQSTLQLTDATADLLAHKAAIDGTEQRVEVFSSRFDQAGAGVLPKGWRTFDSSTQRLGAQTGLGSGCRILQFTGATRDFSYGMYIRNISGGANQGFCKFGALGCDSVLTLTPGKYTYRYKVCNWNMSAFGAITGKITKREDSTAVLFTNTVTPTVNIGNNATNSFSGATTVETTFNLTSTGNYALEFYTSNAGWADAIVTEISLVKSVYTSVLPVLKDRSIRQVRYFTFSGIEIPKPVRGLYLKRTLYDDGSFSTEKLCIP